MTRRIHPMKSNTIFRLITILVTTSILFSCDKNSLDNTFFWDQTGCSDPWDIIENDQNKGTASRVRDYLTGIGIHVKSLGLKDNRKSGELQCNACHCPTGLRILVKIKEKDTYKILELGFKKA